MSVRYVVNTGTGKFRICKLAFQNLHAITSSKVRHIVKQTKNGQPTVSPSLRGKHTHRPNRLPAETREEVQNHIRSFPSESSHYSRAKNANRRYLAPTLTINSMYRLYAKQCIDDKKQPVSSTMYRQIFTTDFNLGFGSPRSDTCSRCEVISETEELENHKQMANAAFECQRLDRAQARSGSCVFITFDMEKTLPLPKLNVGEAFYLRQLWLYNTGIHLIQQKGERAFFHIWTEDEGRRGVTEVGSSLLHFIDTAGVSGSDQTLIAWGDSCSGQNKNFALVCFWEYIVLSGRFKCVDHKFPEPGHSYLDSDRDFGKVEAAVRRHESVYTVDDYHQIMTNSQTKVTVTRVGDKMVNIAALSSLLGLRKKTVNTLGEKVQLRDKVRWIRVTDFGKYDYKHSLTDEEPWKTVILAGCDSPNLYVPELLRRRQLPINPAKLNDIWKQLKFVPSRYQALYLGLTSGIVDVVDSEGEMATCRPYTSYTLPCNVHNCKLFLWKCIIYGYERKINLVATGATFSISQNPRWRPPPS